MSALHVRTARAGWHCPQAAGSDSDSAASFALLHSHPKTIRPTTKAQPESSASGSIRSPSIDQSSEPNESVLPRILNKVGARSSPRNNSEKWHWWSPKTRGRIAVGARGDSWSILYHYSLRLSRGLQLGSQKQGKGKRAAADSALSVPKRRSRTTQAHQDNGPVTSSPLSAELMHDETRSNSHADNESTDNHDQEHLRQFPASLDGSSEPGTEGRSATLAPPPTQGSTFDADSAQVVRMALSLSEGRRRQLSERRNVSGNLDSNAAGLLHTSEPDRCASDVNETAFGHASAAGWQRSIYKYPAGQLFISHLLAVHQTRALICKSTRVIRFPARVLITSNCLVPRQQEYRKQRLYFELAHEYRRLLSHLPPIRSPSDVSIHEDEGTYSQTLQSITICAEPQASHLGQSRDRRRSGRAGTISKRYVPGLTQ